MMVNESYQIIVDENDMINTILSGIKIKNVVVQDRDWIDKFNNMSRFFDLNYQIEAEEPSKNKETYFNECVNTWYIPREYQDIDVDKYVIEKCKTTEEINRVKAELYEFKKRNLYNLLRFLIYFVDTLRNNNIIWGVGRGSSVSSYVLYLIGIHRVNSLKYDLDIGEFLK